MQWRDDFATGIPKIDEQHKMLFAMVHDFQLALHEGYGAKVYGGLLDALDLYCRTHFGFEERCMLEHECPVATKNAQSHSRFVEVLKGFRERFTTHGYRHPDATDLVETANAWLSGHICGIDVHLRNYVNRPPAIS